MTGGVPTKRSSCITCQPGLEAWLTDQMVPLKLRLLKSQGLEIRISAPKAFEASRFEGLTGSQASGAGCIRSA